MLCQLKPQHDPRLLVGLGTSDDAGVYKLSDTIALIQTLDFFTPIVDDPYLFGQIAAANSLSDVYAMGGQPLTAMNIVGFPIGILDKEVLLQILQGGQSKVNEAGALIVGGHTIDDPEPKYGLSITGVVHPEDVLTNSGAKPGDCLILTKPLGTGILATADRADMFSAGVQAAKTSMGMLNRVAAETAKNFSVHACTDITGFGLLGHLYEMMAASGVCGEIDSRRLPLLPDALAAAESGLVPAGAYANRSYLKQVAFSPTVSEALKDLVFDPQTSGGLLYSLPEKEAVNLLNSLQSAGLTQAMIIGQIKKEGNGEIYVY